MTPHLCGLAEEVHTAGAATNRALPLSETRLDRQQRALSGVVLGFADQLDRFLHGMVWGSNDESAEEHMRYSANRRIREETTGSYIEVTPVVSLVDGEGVTMDVDIGAKVRLPRLAERVQLFFDRFPEDEDVFDSLGARGRPRGAGDENKEGAVGLRYFLTEGTRFRSSVSAGMSFKPEPAPRLKLLGRWTKKRDPWTIRFSQSVFWESDDGFGEKTQLDAIRRINEQNDVRASTALIWSETSEGVEAGQAFTFTHVFSRRRVIAPRIGVGGHIEPSAVVDRYFLRVPYRQRIHRGWIFFEIEPGVDFPDDREFEATPLIIVRFDFLFGAIPP